MRLRQIEVFHAVYANGSISAAARALSVSQPSVSKVLRHAESQLGIVLFKLVRGRLVPTDEAHALFREVDEIFQRIGSLRQTTTNLRNAGAGHLRIGVVPSLGLDVVPSAIATFRRSHPEVTFDVQTLHHDDVLRLLYERECDLALVYDPPPHPRLATRLVAEGSVVLLAPRGAFKGSRDILPLGELSGSDMIDVTNSGPVGEIASAGLAKANVVFRRVASVGTYYIAAALVRFGCGVALVDEFTAKAVEMDRLRVLGVTPAMRFGVHAAWLEDRPLSALAERFLTTATSAITGQVTRRTTA
jgi:DNA-binding transcriptional LysR family regulator